MPRIRHAFQIAAQGITLLEVALAMMIMAVLSIGVSSLIKTGMETQMAERMHQHMQTISNVIVDDLRLDFREVDSVTISSGGNTMLLSTPKGNITYQLSNGNLTRRAQGGTAKTYNDPTTYNNLLEVACPGGPVVPGGPNVQGCFAPSSINSSGSPRQVVIPALQIQQKNSTGTVVDRYFGTPNYTVRNFAFDVVSATEFQ